MKNKRKNSKNLLLLVFLIVLLLITFAFKDFILIKKKLDYLYKKTEKMFDIKMKTLHTISFQVHIAFENIGNQAYDILTSREGDLKNVYNRQFRDALTSLRREIEYYYKHLPYSVRYSRHLFFIFNYIYYPIRLNTLFMIEIFLIVSIIIMILFILYNKQDNQMDLIKSIEKKGK